VARVVDTCKRDHDPSASFRGGARPARRRHRPFRDNRLMNRGDAQALVAALIALDVATIAGFLVFYGQAVTRFGHRMAATLWRSLHVRVPALVAATFTVVGLVIWARVPTAGGQVGSRWYGPLIVGIQILVWVGWLGS
jgi:hypothetical protein